MMQWIAKILQIAPPIVCFLFSSFTLFQVLKRLQDLVIFQEKMSLKMIKSIQIHRLILFTAIMFACSHSMAWVPLALGTEPSATRMMLQPCFHIGSLCGIAMVLAFAAKSWEGYLILTNFLSDDQKKGIQYANKAFMVLIPIIFIASIALFCFLQKTKIALLIAYSALMMISVYFMATMYWVVGILKNFIFRNEHLIKQCSNAGYYVFATFLSHCVAMVLLSVPAIEPVAKIVAFASTVVLLVEQQNIMTMFRVEVHQFKKEVLKPESKRSSILSSNQDPKQQENSLLLSTSQKNKQ